MKQIFLVLLLLGTGAQVLAGSDPAYFVYDGNPIAAKYSAGQVIQLPSVTVWDLDQIQQLEAVSALKRASRLSALTKSPRLQPATLSPPRLPEYGVTMFETSLEASAEASDKRSLALIWSGATLFREVAFDLPGIGADQSRQLVARSRREVEPSLDFRAYPPVGRRLQLEAPALIRDYGRTSEASHLAFIDITWRIKDLPDALANRGIDSTQPYLRVEYVIDTRSNRPVFVNVSNVGGQMDREMRLFKEERGPLLMAVEISCSDGSGALLLDLERDSYGTGRKGDVQSNWECYPAH